MRDGKKVTRTPHLALPTSLSSTSRKVNVKAHLGLLERNRFRAATCRAHDQWVYRPNVPIAQQVPKGFHEAMVSSMFLGCTPLQM